MANWRAWWCERGADGLAATAARRGFVLSSAELAELGISRQVARTAVAKGRWTAAARGFVAPISTGDGSPLDHRRRHAVSAAAAVRSRGGLGSGRSAAILHGLPTLAVPVTPELTAAAAVGGGHRPSRHVYRAGIRPWEHTTWYGVGVTTVARTLVDLARHNPRDGIMAADAALHEEIVQAEAIQHALESAGGWPGVRQARDVLALASPLAESPLESITRLALHDDEFPTPELQVWIGPFRVDLLLAQRRLVIEADGRGKYTDDELWQEKVREQRLRAMGYRVERVIWSDVTRNWPATSARLRTALLT